MGFKPGDHVRYHPVIGQQSDGKQWVIERTGTLQSGDHVAWLLGKSGCVGVDSLSPWPSDSLLRAARIEGARAALEAAAERAMTEEELDGPPPPEIAKDFRNVERAVVHLRAAVKSTKSGIAEGILRLSPESVVEGMEK